MNKIIQLDKLFCSIDLEKEQPKKRKCDSQEFKSSIRKYGFESVAKSSEIVHLATQQFIDNKKAEKKALKSTKKEKIDE